MTRIVFNPLPDDKIVDWSKLKQIAEDILRYILHEKQVPYRVESIVKKGEIACYTIQRAIHTIKGNDSKCRIMPLVSTYTFYPLS